jgi:hypothetical protein
MCMLPQRCYYANNTTDPHLAYVPALPTPQYRFAGQFADTGKWTTPERVVGK